LSRPAQDITSNVADVSPRLSPGRNPNDAPDGNFDGYNFWLTKLSQFNGNYINAEMVKAFLSSTEYRRRFGP